MLATMSIALCLLASCGGLVTLLGALPLAIWGLKLSREALDGDGVQEIVEAYAIPARNLNAAALVYSALYLLFIAAFLSLYAMAIVAVVLAGP